MHDPKNISQEEHGESVSRNGTSTDVSVANPSSRWLSFWQRNLSDVLAYYDSRRQAFRWFFPGLFAFFVVLNTVCYWFAILTAFPSIALGEKSTEYFLLQFPVGILGAVFDSASFFITIWIARRAIQTQRIRTVILHLSIDGLIAILASLWVLFVFIVSGWLISYVLGTPEGLGSRGELYSNRILYALKYPLRNMKNIYFGTMMGCSAALPTFVHVWMCLRSLVYVLRFPVGKASEEKHPCEIEKDGASGQINVEKKEWTSSDMSVKHDLFQGESRKTDNREGEACQGGTERVLNDEGVSHHIPD
ncbi:MAG: hypothetical protein VX278_24190 [Myxococcota bacterium]|nr:hypothetical protein [Myxococcota bacterium]